jgi:5-methylcytosine-specific restriction endonuclease McrA
LPKVKEGTDELENLALACQTCNNYKYTKTEAIDLLTKKAVPIYHPRKDVWNEHFTWNSDFTKLIGISPTGRATIEILKLNREGVRNLRFVLYSVGKHPPK